ncbi:MAG: FGGY-family carbohydrate kinase [Epibacterium sp.]|nr:FGGY-family carbohydrate kinase [Epibacterium sp.]NQX74411.1 FGGY-family carbohydrate kinase [Epibacterium sp.]
MTLCLGVDIGTSGVRTAVVDGNKVVSMARAEHPVQDPSRIDANGWWVAVQTCLTAQITALNEIGVDPAEITDVAVDGTSGSMVLTDAALTPVSRGLMYNSKGFDAEAEKIAACAPDDHITKGSNSALARAMRLVSLAQGTPVHLLHQADFIAAKLMGQGGHSDYNNALKTGYDPELECWPDWVKQVIDPSLLPKVHNPGAPIATLSADWARYFQMSPDAMVHAGTTDSIAAFLASAPLEQGVAVTSLGSTLAIKLLSRTRIDSPKVGLYSHRLGDLWLVGGASNTGGAVLRKHFSDEELRHLSAQIDPNDPLDLEYYPLNTPGERFPINDPDLAPILHPRPRDKARYLQAMLEAMSRIENHCYREIQNRGGSVPSEIYTAGGGAQNDVWTAIRARHIGLWPKAAPQSEASVGAAKLAQSASI